MKDLLPPNATPLERAVDSASARLDEIPVPVSDLWSPARCPLKLLPWLAWALGVEEWDEDWPERVRRRACAEAFEVHRLKGTKAALDRVLRMIEAEYDYIPEPKGVAMTALVRIFNSAEIAADGLAGVKSALDRVKRLSLHLEIELHAGPVGTIPVAGRLGAAQLAAFEARF